MKILYFTGTGNGLAIARKIGGECLSIPKLIRDGIYEISDDKVGIVFPVYYNGVPKIVERYFSKAKIKSNYIFAITSFGAFSGAATRHIEAIGRKNGITFSYINEIKMPDNYLPGFDMKVEKVKLSAAEIEKELDKISDDIKDSKQYMKKHFILTQVIRKLARTAYNKPFEKNFSVDEKCISCKTCEKICPVDNIIVDVKPKYGNHCEQCLACVQNCPTKAIHVKGEKNDERYRNPQTSVNDLIGANN